MAVFKENKIPYYNRIKYLSPEKQEEAIAILERANKHRDELMRDRIILKNTLRNIEYAKDRLAYLEKDKLHFMFQIASKAPAEYFAELETVEKATEKATVEVEEAASVTEYGIAIPDYEGSENIGESDSEDEDI